MGNIQEYFRLAILSLYVAFCQKSIWYALWTSTLLVNLIWLWLWLWFRMLSWICGAINCVVKWLILSGSRMQKFPMGTSLNWRPQYFNIWTFEHLNLHRFIRTYLALFLSHLMEVSWLRTSKSDLTSLSFARMNNATLAPASRYLENGWVATSESPPDKKR